MARLGKEMRDFDAMGVDVFHFDIMDGHFVPNLTFGPAFVKAARTCSEKEFDVHLMVSAPENWIDAFSDAGCDAISFHAEIKIDHGALIEKIKAKNIKTGLAFNPETSLNDIDAAIFEALDRVLIMTVKPGFGGQQFIDQSSKIKNLATLYPHLDIMVDGGINEKTAQIVRDAGATTLVSGSALAQSSNRAALLAALKGAA